MKPVYILESVRTPRAKAKESGGLHDLSPFELLDSLYKFYSTNQILDPNWSNQNAFLAQNEGLESGLMILQYVSAAVLAEMNLLANSVTTTNIPVSLGKEDHVSMGATGSYRLLQQTKFLSFILANEFICSSVALDNISETASDSVSKIHDWIRETVPPLMGDRAFSIDTENLASKILDGLLCNIFEA